MLISPYCAPVPGCAHLASKQATVQPYSDFKIVAPDHELFRFVAEKDVVRHFHGLLHPPSGAISLVKIAPEAGGGVDGTVLYDHPAIADGKGRMIVTTLDPFYHTGSYFMPAAERFLSGLLAWTDEKFRGLPHNNVA